jgi:zinc protease
MHSLPHDTEIACLPQIPSGVRVHRLDNGLELIIREDASAPVVSVQAWARAGSIHEGQWLGAGLSHVLEHMLFKGTSTRGAGRIDQEVQAAGGYMNAYTSFDRTVYWINVPDSGATTAIDILCDIFQNATLPADELEKELDVIRREMDMGEDDPGRRSSKGLFSAAYTKSPYRYPVIGLLDLFNRITREDLLAYYRAHYAPNNCFLVVVGNVKADAVIEQVRKAYEGTQARTIPVNYLLPEPRQMSPREELELAPVEHAHFHLGWHIPDLTHPDVPVLDVLSTLLGGGRSSRLYQAVRERSSLTHSVSAWTYTPGLSGLFGVSGVCDGAKFPEAQTAILREVARMGNEPVSSAELAKAVKQFTVGTLSSRKTMEGQAQDLGGNWIATQDLHFSERYLAAVRAVTPADLIRVVQTYLRDDNRTVFALLPKESGTPKEFRVPEVVAHPIVTRTLSNGLRVLVKEDHRLPFVELRAVFEGGLRVETAADSGITSMLSRLFIKGTPTRSAEDIAREIEGMGGSIEAYAGNNTFGLSGEVMREDLQQGLELFTDILLRPSFPEAALEREREAQLASIRGQRDQLLQCAFKAMRRGLFGEQGYGLDSLGSESVVRSLTSADLRAFHSRWTVPGNAVLAVFGDVDPDGLIATLETLLGGWKDRPRPALPVPSPVDRVARSESSREKEQAVVVLGFPGTHLRSPDRFALELIQEACSDMGSRLFMRIRDELGLAYYVGASQLTGQTPGYFAFYCGTAPDQLELVEKELRAQAEILRTEGLSEEELARAKAKIIGQKKIARQDLGGFAMSTALDELYGLGHSHFETETHRFEAVTVDEIRAVARRHLDPERSVVAMVRGQG